MAILLANFCVRAIIRTLCAPDRKTRGADSVKKTKEPWAAIVVTVDAAAAIRTVRTASRAARRMQRSRASLIPAEPS